MAQMQGNVLTNPPRVCFGPELPEWGSWQWLGSDTAQALRDRFTVSHFPPWRIPGCDVLVVIKHPPPHRVQVEIPPQTRIIYCPVDFYGSLREIEADAQWLRRCSRIVIHCERLRSLFEPYASVLYFEHHVKFVSELRSEPARGPFLWVGARSNLFPLTQWLHRYPLPGELVVLTNPEIPGNLPSPAALGFPRHCAIQIKEWSPEIHRIEVARCCAAIDVKGNDFRSRHKPPAKALDFLASGAPLAMPSPCSPVEHLAKMGFQIPSPLQVGYWLSEEHQQEVARFGAAVRELFSLSRITRGWAWLIHQVLQEPGDNRSKLTDRKLGDHGRTS